MEFEKTKLDNHTTILYHKYINEPIPLPKTAEAKKLYHPQPIQAQGQDIVIVEYEKTDKFKDN